ncbi:unnamed protein product [Paramecium octaurelia]|uniref:Poly [ADP-ribose] polymerase n=1 Tax=Paramecium octaurelia TaxID=43137 RepID=A0A8S1XXR6_PAROT|nr:unnamed protein product [Paramecium octaurelia]
MPPKKPTSKVTSSPPPTGRATRSKKTDKAEDKKQEIIDKAVKDVSQSKDKDGKANLSPKNIPSRKNSKKSKSPSPIKNGQDGKQKDDTSNINKGTISAPVDEYFDDQENYVVYEENGKIYDCMMNQTNIMGANNNNKFYIVQLLKKKDKDFFYLYTRWGRVGVEGSSAKQSFLKTESAKKAYESKVRQKSVKGEYRVLERDYSGEQDQQELMRLETLREQREKQSYYKSELHTKIKDLVRLIFDMKMINNQMKDIGYDAKKTPLGKLAVSTIKKGFEVLKQISEELQNKIPDYTVLERLSSEFYSQIPHDFGFLRAPVIETPQMVKIKLDMLESIQHIQIATKILEENSDDSNVIDENFKKLGINMQFLEPTDEKVSTIKQFVQNTHCETHRGYGLEVLDVFELQKEQDDNRFKKELGNRMLLWHGSRLTNFVGILSQGLRIAPPEAPVTGYMFGKGVYFADMVSKSANYCAVTKENNTGLILLCDVALGNPNEKFYSDYHANQLPQGKHSTWGRGKTMPPQSENIPFPGMPEVKVPIGKGVPSGVPNTSLLYNEFIVYDVAQIRLKYLIKMKWNFK